MMLALGEGGHPVFRVTSALAGGPLQSKGCGRKSIHHNADPTVERPQRIIVSVSQPWWIGAKILLGKSQLILHLARETQLDDAAFQIPSADVSNLTKSPVFFMVAPRNSVQRHKEKFENPQKLLTLLCSSLLKFTQDIAVQAHVESIQTRTEKELFEATPKNWSGFGSQRCGTLRPLWNCNQDLSGKGDPSRWYRPPLRHQPHRSINGNGTTNPPFGGLTIIPTTSREDDGANEREKLSLFSSRPL